MRINLGSLLGLGAWFNVLVSGSSHQYFISDMRVSWGLGSDMVWDDIVGRTSILPLQGCTQLNVTDSNQFFNFFKKNVKSDLNVTDCRQVCKLWTWPSILFGEITLWCQKMKVITTQSFLAALKMQQWSVYTITLQYFRSPPISPLALDCNNYICVARNSQQHMPTAVRVPRCCPTTTGSEAHLLWGSAACWYCIVMVTWDNIGS